MNGPFIWSSRLMQVTTASTDVHDTACCPMCCETQRALRELAFMPLIVQILLKSQATEGVGPLEMLRPWCRKRHGGGRVSPVGERGASLVEYSLLIALIAVVCLGAVTFFGAELTQSLSTSGASITN